MSAKEGCGAVCIACANVLQILKVYFVAKFLTKGK